MAFRRTSLSDFSLANLAYAGVTVAVYGVLNGAKNTADLVTLYDDITGVGTLTNPQVLDSEGKWPVPTYAEVSVVIQVTGTATGDHDTGIIYPSLSDADVAAAATSATAAAGSGTAAAGSATAAGGSATAAAASAVAAANSAALFDEDQIALIARSFG